MSDGVIFVVAFGGLFILRIIAATVVFLWILPEGTRCPHCDAVTLRVQSAGWNRLMPWFRTSWCYECGMGWAPSRNPAALDANPGVRTTYSAPTADIREGPQALTQRRPAALIA